MVFSDNLIKFGDNTNIRGCITHRILVFVTNHLNEWINGSYVITMTNDELRPYVDSYIVIYSPNKYVNVTNNALMKNNNDVRRDTVKNT